MRRQITLILLVLASLAGGASADQIFELVPVDSSAVRPGDDALAPDFNDGSYFTFDLMVTTVDADFKAAEIDATLVGPAAFFQHPVGDHVPPDAGLFDEYPALEFDTFFDGGPGSSVGIVWLVDEPQFIHAEWFDTGAELWNDTYRIARFGFRFRERGIATLTVEGQSANPAGSGLHFPIGPLEATVEYAPEPNTLAFATLVTVMVTRRRRA